MGKRKNSKRSRKPVLKPHWDLATRTLTLGVRIVHRFTRPAPVAQAILNVFEEEGWVRRIDDPLPPLDGRNEADRLRKEVYALNRRLTNPLIKFRLDGTGQGICWELT